MDLLEPKKSQRPVGSLVGKILDNVYKIEKLIRKGEHSEVYEAYDRIMRQKVAFKISSNLRYRNAVTKEIETLTELKEKWDYPLDGISQIYSWGMWKSSEYIVLNLCGPSLRQLQTERGKAPLPTVLLMLDQVIPYLKELHGRKFIHGDLNPQNIQLGAGDQTNKLYLVDFGEAIRYIDDMFDMHIPDLREYVVRGTITFRSIRCHEGRHLGRKDDLESLAYVALDLLTNGNLPWSGSNLGNLGDPNLKALDIKKNMTPEQMFAGFPREFSNFLERVLNLPFKAEPEYDEYIEMFRQLGRTLDINYNGLFVWNWEENENHGSSDDSGHIRLNRRAKRQRVRFASI